MPERGQIKVIHWLTEELLTISEYPMENTFQVCPNISPVISEREVQWQNCIKYGNFVPQRISNFSLF